MEETGPPDSPKNTPDAATTASEIPAQPIKERTPGLAKIKEEYILHDYKPRLEENYVSDKVKETILPILSQKRAATSSDETSELKRADENDADGKNGNETAAVVTKEAESTEEPPAKKIKLKGQNKRKIKDRWRELDGDKLCVTILLDRECSFGDKCKYSHDVEKYIANKKPDLGSECPSYRNLGRCTYGVTCRFANDHFKDMKNSVNDDLIKKVTAAPPTLNTWNTAIIQKLRKRAISFPKAAVYLKSIGVKPWYKMEGPPCDRSLCMNPPKKSIAEPAIASSDSGSATPSNSTATTTVTQKTDVAGASMDGKVDDSVDIKADEIPLNSSQNENPTTKSATIENTDTGANTDEIRLRPQEKRRIDFKDKLYLAPLTTVGNLPFRRICKQFGADITCGEMAIATNIMQGKHAEWALLKRHETEDIFGVQLCGGHADSMTRCAELINSTCDVDFIDINVGCPIDLVFKKGEGSALMNRWSRLELLVRGMSSVLDCPLTVKMRTGVYENENIAHKLIPKCREWGASLVTLHGRSREQRYTKSANWDYIAECAKAANPMPLFGNGDVLSYEDYELFRAKADVSGAMIARGALIKPWIFTEIKERRHWDIRSNERLDMLKEFVNCGLMHWGSDPQGVETTRRFLLEWQSFLYRYVPVGLLELVPQKINERPPAYRGRDELETLMASANCADWIKISEMLLGPVPDGFSFLPKHKANAYK